MTCEHGCCPKEVLDLFSGAGGAAMGLHKAWPHAHIVGVDHKPMPRYPFDHVVADAMTYQLEGYDFIWASPPCQAYSTATHDPTKHPDLYAATRARLLAAGIPFAIENVIGAPYAYGVVLCGTMFGLEADGEWIRRHRNVETSWLIFQPPHKHRRDRRAITVTGKCFLTVTKDCARHSRQPTFATACGAMGIGWMTRKELPQAIPPAYAAFIARQLTPALAAVAV